MRKLSYISFTLSTCILLSACSVDLPFLHSDANIATMQETEDLSTLEPETEEEPISEAEAEQETEPDEETEEVGEEVAEEVAEDFQEETVEDEAEDTEDEEGSVEDIPEKEEFSLSAALGGKVKGELTSLGVTYRFYENGAEIMGIENDFAEIPEQIEYEGNVYPVISLQNVYLEASEFRIPEHIKYIKDAAFRDSKIETIVIPDTVEYLSGYRTFQDCKYLTSIVFEGVFETDSNWNQTFMGCGNLAEGVIPEGVLTTYKTFYGCDSMTSVSLPDSLTAIGENMLSNCHSLETVSISDNIELIDNGAFFASGIKYIDIPENVNTVALSAFDGCSQLEELNMVDTTDYKAGYLKNMDSLKTLRISKIDDVDKIRTIEAPKLELAVFPDNTEEIREDFFWSVEEKGSLTVQVPVKTVTYFQKKFPEVNVVAKE